jgi:hypothetical protein
MNGAGKFIGLSNSEKALIFRAMFWVLLYRMGLWILPFRRAENWMIRSEVPAVSTVMNKDESIVGDTVRSVRLCSRYVPHATCLTQALAARSLLSRQGQPAVLKIGVAKSDGNFEAHAWLEVDGRIVLGKRPFHSRYAVLGASRPVPV